MNRCSHEIGALAAALAKAQAEIENPPKSLTATIESPFPREGQRSFRYAPLSAGLDIVRKCLSRHEIATLQATAIDSDSGLIRLTTSLIHASGEWMSSDWPVCPISETAAPHRLGAALTYARRYALFTLVGIAGEDDLDAPDLAVAGPALPSSGAPDLHKPSDKAWKPVVTSALSQTASRSAGAGRPKPAQLAADASVRLRDRLIFELEQTDAASLTAWAHRALPFKNQLSIADAQAVELAFDAALARQNDAIDAPEKPRADFDVQSSVRSVPANEIVVMIDKPVRERDRHHLRFVAAQPCLICGRTPSDAHHVKFAQGPALGRKVSDRFTVPLCRLHHRELHRRGNERPWWQRQGIDPLAVAVSLWRNSHALDAIADEAAPPTRSERINGEAASSPSSTTPNRRD
jgi:ERF superfamily